MGCVGGPRGRGVGGVGGVRGSGRRVGGSGSRGVWVSGCGGVGQRRGAPAMPGGASAARWRSSGASWAPHSAPQRHANDALASPHRLHSGASRRTPRGAPAVALHASPTAPQRPSWTSGSPLSVWAPLREGAPPLEQSMIVHGPPSGPGDGRAHDSVQLIRRPSLGSKSPDIWPTSPQNLVNTAKRVAEFALARILIQWRSAGRPLLPGIHGSYARRRLLISEETTKCIADCEIALARCAIKGTIMRSIMIWPHWIGARRAGAPRAPATARGASSLPAGGAARPTLSLEHNLAAPCRVGDTCRKCCRAVGLTVGRTVRRSILCLGRRSVDRTVGGPVARSLARSSGRSVDRWDGSYCQSVHRSCARRGLVISEETAFEMSGRTWAVCH